MRRDGLLHPRLAAVVAGIGHTQTLAVADPGLPVPPGVERIELGFAPNRPAFLDVVAAILDELVAESALVADELDPAGELHAGLAERLAAVGVAVETVPHDELKTRLHDCVAVVRTGEFTPYANVVFRAGVPF